MYAYYYYYYYDPEDGHISGRNMWRLLRHKITFIHSSAFIGLLNNITHLFNARDMEHNITHLFNARDMEHKAKVARRLGFYIKGEICSYVL